MQVGRAGVRVGWAAVQGVGLRFRSLRWVSGLVRSGRGPRAGVQTLDITPPATATAARSGPHDRQLPQPRAAVRTTGNCRVNLRNVSDDR